MSASRRDRTAMKTHAPDGTLIPFDREAIAKQLGGCLVCGAPITAVGLYAPKTKAMRAVVSRLSPHPIPDGWNSGIFWGLCWAHFVEPDLTARVEAALKVKAERRPLR